MALPTLVATKEEFADYLINGFWDDFGFYPHRWASSPVTYSLSSEFTVGEQNGFRAAFTQWSDVANITFQEVSSGGQINILEGDDFLAGTSTRIFLPSLNIYSSTISIDTSSGFYGSDTGEIGNYAFMTAIHEIGHALGLGHSGNYNGSATYEDDAIWANDTRQYSLMSYFNAVWSGADHGGEYASTPMLMDIFAIQQIYGANTSTRAGDTVYGFNTNTGLDQFDFSLTPQPVITIWDGNGIDTIDVTRYTVDQYVDLREGAFSHVGGLTGNVSIAYGAIIENIQGGKANDTLIGNDASNYIYGGRGNDLIYGLDDNDKLLGGRGNDVIYGGLGNDDLRGKEDDDLLYGEEGNDRVEGDDGNDIIFGGDGDDRLYGEKGNDIIFGGDGKDYINGGSGDDIISGGGGLDRLLGGKGADQFLFTGDGVFDGLTRIKDLHVEEGDFIRFEDVFEGYDPLNDVISDFVRFSESTKHSYLYIDRDGDGTDYSMQQIVRIEYVTDAWSDLDDLIDSGALDIA